MIFGVGEVVVFNEDLGIGGFGLVDVYLFGVGYLYV